MPLLERAGQPALHYTIDDFTDPWRDAPVLVLQHGNGRSGRFWYQWVPYLSRHFRVVRPDMRGLGGSSTAFDLERDLTVEALVGDLVAVFDALGARRVHFCGESMGGILGIALAALHPERVRTLSLVSTPVFISDRMKQSYAMGHGSRIDAMKQMGIVEWIKATNRSTRFPPDTPEGFLDWYAREFAANSTEVQLAMSALVNRANAQSLLPRVACPVLGLYPTSGQITSGEQEAMLEANLRDFRLVHMPTAYHMVHQIMPAACARHVLHFCAAADGVPVIEA